jgi:hypothetical protein
MALPNGITTGDAGGMTERPGRRRITAGLSGGPLDRAVLDHAAAACRARHLPLHVLHAAPPLPVPTDPVAATIQRRIGEVAASRLLRDAFRHVRTRWPGVAMTAQLAHHRPARALADAADRSALLVVGQHCGRHRSAACTATRLRAAARCPVLVVMAAGTPTDPAPLVRESS